MSDTETLAAFDEAQAALLLPKSVSTGTVPSHTPKFTRLSWLEKLTIKDLHAKGTGITAIAHALQREYTTVSDELRRQAVRGQDVLALHGPELAEFMITAAGVAAAEGNHRPALDALLHSRQVDQLEQAQSSGIIIQIGMASPGTPHDPLSPQLPVLTAHAITVSDDKQ